MTPNKNFSTRHDEYTARYLVLLSQHESTRALLFGRDQRYLAELFNDDNGLMLETLMRNGRECPAPRMVAEQAWAGAPASVVCFALDTEH